MSISRRSHLAATGLLLCATIGWGLSFPLSKAAELVQAQAAPLAGSVFLSALQVFLRFGLAAVLMLVYSVRTVRGMRPEEVQQGIALGLFSGVGTLLQMDGLCHTQASTSAFLTQATCVLVPLILCAQRRRAPPAAALACSCLILLGVGVLAHVSPRNLRVGRGELETLLAAISFSFQILLLGAPRFALNRARHSTTVMFACVALLTLPVVFFTMRDFSDLEAACAPLAGGALIAVLAVVCTILPFTLMNHSQKEVSATAATVTYCFEPVFATAFAMVLPQWLAVTSGINYQNEILSNRLWLGGSLILAANLVALRFPLQ